MTNEIDKILAPYVETRKYNIVEPLGTELSNTEYGISLLKLASKYSGNTSEQLINGSFRIQFPEKADLIIPKFPEIGARNREPIIIGGIKEGSAEMLEKKVKNDFEGAYAFREIKN